MGLGRSRRCSEESCKETEGRKNCLRAAAGELSCQSQQQPEPQTDRGCCSRSAAPLGATGSSSPAPPLHLHLSTHYKPRSPQPRAAVTPLLPRHQSSRSPSYQQALPQHMQAAHRPQRKDQTPCLRASVSQTAWERSIFRWRLDLGTIRKEQNCKILGSCKISGKFLAKH